MKIGSRYKIARRLGAQVFEKTAGKKYALRAEQSGKGEKRGPKSDFGIQMLEKQKVRFTYLLTERQFSKYIRAVLEMKLSKPEEKVFEVLESRLDNAVLRGGLAHTRFLARQLVSHGHITVNGKKVMIPSYNVKKGDVISVREGSKDKPMFVALEEKNKDVTIPTWLSLDLGKKQISVTGLPTYNPTEVPFNLTTVLEFYRR